jgi:hypothetical protein
LKSAFLLAACRFSAGGWPQIIRYEAEDREVRKQRMLLRTKMTRECVDETTREGLVWQ